MKFHCVIFFVCVGASAATWGEDMTTLTGQTYSNIAVQRYDWEGIYVRHDAGISKVYYREISVELRDHYKKMVPLPTPEEMIIPTPSGSVGENDLPTLSGQIYRDVTVKRVEADAVHVGHDGGVAKVYFSEIPEEIREKFRTVSPPSVPEIPPGPNDLATTEGQIYRNVQVRNIEPDGLTFHHDGGVTRVGFTALPEELQKKYEYDPKAAVAYQKAMTEAKKQAENGQAAIRAQNEAAHQKQVKAEPIRVFEVRTDKVKKTAFGIHQYRVRFSVRNYDDNPCIIRVTVGDYGHGKFTIPANSTQAGLEVIGQYVQPKTLTVSSGSYSTNQILHW